MNILSRLFSFQGRIGRLAYLGVGLGIGFASFVVFLGMVSYFDMPFPPKTPADLQAFAEAKSKLIIPNLAWSALIYWICFANSAKRLHDIGRSGWLNLWIFLGMLGTALVAGVGAALQNRGVIIVGGILVLIVTLYALWIGLLQLFKRGDEDANDYGDPPGGGAGRRRRVVRVFEASPAPAPRIAAVEAGGGGFGKRRA